MLDTIKTYFVEVVMKKATNAGIQSIVSSFLIILAVHADYLETLGITTFDWGKGWPHPLTPPTGMCTLIEWDTLTMGGGAALFGLAMMAYAFFQHHTVAAVTGAPQSGDKRETPTQPVEGGQRANDPPKAA